MMSIYNNEMPEVEAPPPRRPPPRFGDDWLHRPPDPPPRAARQPRRMPRLTNPDDALAIVGFAALWLVFLLVLVDFLSRPPALFPFYALAGAILGALTGVVLAEIILRQR